MSTFCGHFWIPSNFFVKFHFFCSYLSWNSFCPYWLWLFLLGAVTELWIYFFSHIHSVLLECGNFSTPTHDQGIDCFRYMNSVTMTSPFNQALINPGGLCLFDDLVSLAILPILIQYNNSGKLSQINFLTIFGFCSWSVGDFTKQNWRASFNSNTVRNSRRSRFFIRFGSPKIWLNLYL